MSEARRCGWCGKDRVKFSDWEQDSHTKGWMRLCARCATRRLNNPYNALLPMRKIAATPDDTRKAGDDR